MMLSGSRALDLTDEKGYLCGRILADLGVDVIKVEPPGGDPGRRHGPFYGGEEHPERSLFWYAYNLGKRGITLSLETTEGRGILEALARKVDFVLESYPPGQMDELKIGFGRLRDINPGIVYTSITPFGQNGPYSRYKASDLIVAAMSGFMFLTGDPDRPPVRVSFPVNYLLASCYAALGTLMAFYNRQRTGAGQHVDTSAQESVVSTLCNALPAWELNKVLAKRAGSFWYRIGLTSETQQRLLWPCANGAVCFMATGGKAGERSNKALVQWMAEEGFCDQFLRSIDWGTFSIPSATQEFHQEFEARLGQFFIRHTKEYLHKGAQERGILLQLVGTPRDTLDDEQLNAREFWSNISHPELSTIIKYPGSFYKTSTGATRLGPRAPMVGEHNNDFLQAELGLSAEELQGLRERGVI